MLALELAGKDYNKAERNRELHKLLPTRSRGSIEFKHQNISAVFIEMGYPYVKGYKPARNFQNLLREIIERRVYAAPELAATVSELVEQPVQIPVNVGDLLAIQVDPPVRAKKRETLNDKPQAPRARPKRNYLEIEARNRSLGRAGEELALKFEHERLWRAGCKKLAERIDHISENKGDSWGYDILSFETDGRERLVEVKTTRFGVMTPFFASNNEVDVSEQRSAEYNVYRLFDFDKKPRLFQLAGSIRNTCTLEPIQFRASPGTIDD